MQLLGVATKEANDPALTPVRISGDAEQLFDLYFDQVFRFFSRRVRDLEDAQDLTTEVFAAVVPRKCPHRVEPLCWLYGIARRKFADWLRTQKRMAKAPVSVRPEPTYPIDLRGIVDRLPEAQREALLLQALEELSVAQISQSMGRSEKSVKGLLQRAKESVRLEAAAEESQ